MAQQLWERQPNEGIKAYNAFLAYKAMPARAENKEDERSIGNVAKKLGYKGPQQLAEWSAKYKWVSRVEAWEDRQNDIALQVRSVGLVEYQQAVTDNLQQNLRTYDTIIKGALATMLLADEVDTKAILRLGQALKLADDLARRAGNMPTSFTSQPGEEVDYDNIEYTLGEVDA